MESRQLAVLLVSIRLSSRFPPNMHRILMDSPGAVIYPIVLRQLISQPNVGFPWAVRTIGFIVFATNLVPLVVMKPLFLPQGKRTFDKSMFRDRVCKLSPVCRSTLSLIDTRRPAYAPSCKPPSTQDRCS